MACGFSVWHINKLWRLAFSAILGSRLTMAEPIPVRHPDLACLWLGAECAERPILISSEGTRICAWNKVSCPQHHKGKQLQS
jgi:hypothetical protein